MRGALWAFRAYRPPHTRPLSVINATTRGLASDTQSPVLSFDVTTANFQSDVLMNPKPVVLDCYANWCQPCKQVTPLLERAVSEARGQLVLAKLDVDEQSALAQQLQIRSLPTVFGLFQGKMVNHFVGLVSPEEFGQFVNMLLKAGGAPAEAATEDPLESARELLESGQTAEARSIFQEMYKELTSNTDNKASAESRAQQAHCLLGLGLCAKEDSNHEDAQALLKALTVEYSNEVHNDQALRSGVKSLDLYVSAPLEGGNLETLRGQVDANPDDLQKRYDFALTLFQQDAFEEAISQAIERFFQEKVSRLAG